MSRHRSYPPDYCDKEALAYRLNLKPGMVDQLLRRGLLPPPIDIGGAHRWRWDDVDNMLRGVDHADESASDTVPDPYMDGINGPAKKAQHRPATARQARHG